MLELDVCTRSDIAICRPSAFRVALVSAVAIPVTVSATFGLLNAFGIELHQVSIAALIVVLGMVVDDAIVIADNYIELLNQGVDREEAAWRNASLTRSNTSPIVGSPLNSQRSLRSPGSLSLTIRNKTSGSIGGRMSKYGAALDEQFSRA